MSDSKFVKANEKIAEKVAGGYKKVEDGVVKGYKKVEEGVVKGYKAVESAAVGASKKIEDKFVGKFLTHEGETVEDAEKRLKEEQARRETTSDAGRH